MGRGLSDLQKLMLEMSLARLEEDREIRKYNGVSLWKYQSFGYVGFSEVAEAYYHWPSINIDRINFKVHFSKSKIKGYMAGKVAIKKATQRLVKRGLIFVGEPGYRYSNPGCYCVLSEALPKVAELGIQPSKELMAKLGVSKDELLRYHEKMNSLFGYPNG